MGHCKMWIEKSYVFSTLMRCCESRKSGLPVSLSSSLAVTPIHSIITVKVSRSRNKDRRKRGGRRPGDEHVKEPEEKRRCNKIPGVCVYLGNHPVTVREVECGAL